jgi:hypothetical protein
MADWTKKSARAPALRGKPADAHCHSTGSPKARLAPMREFRRVRFDFRVRKYLRLL